MTRPQIRRLALWTTAWCWVVGTGMLMFHGQPFPRAAAVVAASLGGLVVWAIYHGISRRNDGLMVFFTTMVGLDPADDRTDLPLEHDLGRVAVVVVVQALLFAAIGLMVRGARKGDTSPKGSLLWDAQVDRERV